MDNSQDVAEQEASRTSKKQKKAVCWTTLRGLSRKWTAAQRQAVFRPRHPPAGDSDVDGNPLRQEIDPFYRAPWRSKYYARSVSSPRKLPLSNAA